MKQLAEGEKDTIFAGESLLKEGLSLVAEALVFLNSRNQRIISLFFGLEEKKHSLAGIGKKLGITRERVRQIKTESLKKIRKMISLRQESAWKDFFERMETLFVGQGGFIEEEHLGFLLKKTITPREQGALNFLLSLAPSQFSFEKKNSKMKNFWLLKAKEKKDCIDRKVLSEAVDFLIDFFKGEKRPLKKAEIKKNMVAFPGGFFVDYQEEKRTENLLFLGSGIGKNILHQWGLSSWPTIASSITKEKAFLVLKKEGKPLHFREITDSIKKYWPEKKIILQTVHNELIKDSRFALVSRGVYGLCEWGFVKSPVKKIIWDFLRKTNRSLEKKEILEYIMKIKKVKKTTVSVCLSDKRYFQKTKEGKFLATEVASK